MCEMWIVCAIFPQSLRVSRLLLKGQGNDRSAEQAEEMIGLSRPYRSASSLTELQHTHSRQ